MAYIGEKIKAHKIWRGNSDRCHLADLGIDGRILKWILNKQDGSGLD